MIEVIHYHTYISTIQYSATCPVGPLDRPRFPCRRLSSHCKCQYVLPFPLYVFDTCPSSPLNALICVAIKTQETPMTHNNIMEEEATLPPFPPSLSALYPYDGGCYTTTTAISGDSSLYSFIPFSLSSSTNNHNNSIFFSSVPCSNNSNDNSLGTHAVKNESFYEPEKPFDFFAQNAPFYLPNNTSFNDYYCSSSSTSSLTPQLQQHHHQQQQQTKTFDFFSTANQHRNEHQLPELRSLESPPRPAKRRHPLSSATTSSKNDQCRERARLRRQTISDRTSRLRKLMPWDKKTDMATTLEEACKYVRFLQAQVKVLQSMPPLDRYKTLTISNKMSNVDNEMMMAVALGVLSRQQMLEVVLGSKAAQTWLYSKGHCVCSVEQVEELKRSLERRQALRRLMEFGCNIGGGGSLLN